MFDPIVITERLFVNGPAIAFSSLGMVLTVMALCLAHRAVRLLYGSRAGGTIVAWHKRTTDSVTSYAPIFKFRAGMDGEFQIQSSTIWQDQPGDIGAPVSVLYDAKNPERADIETDHHPWRPVLALLALATGALAVAWQAGA